MKPKKAFRILQFVIRGWYYVCTWEAWDADAAVVEFQRLNPAYADRPLKAVPA